MLTELDFNRIPQRKIRHFIDNQIDNHKIRFSDIEPSYHMNRDDSYSIYNVVEDAFLFKESLDKSGGLIGGHHLGCPTLAERSV